MEGVSKALVLFFILLSGIGFSQTSSEKLKKEQARLEQKIADTKLLLGKSKDNTEASLNELKVIENQINYRERLLKNYDNQIRSAELKVQNKEQQIEALRIKVDRLKKQFKKLILYVYKHRNKYGKMMFIFSARDYYEAVKRNLYLQRIKEIQQSQFITIRQHLDLIEEEISAIEEEKKHKMVVIADKRKEKEAIQQDRLRQEQVYQEFKAEEEKILAQLKEEERDKAILRDKIAAAIRREIAEAEAKRKAEEARRKAEEEKRNNATASTSTTETVASPSFAETKEVAALSKSFEGNRGKLPWPVSKGSITEKFGKNPHPTLKNVYTNNRGIDISTPKNAHVQAVFEGEVTSVLNIPGAGKVVIIKHGNYRTVYSNLQDTYVKAGDKVSTKKVIGSLLTKDSGISIAHFEIHKVNGTAVTCLNPSLWVAH